MSEEFKLVFSNPVLLSDPHQKSIDPEEDVYYSVAEVKLPEKDLPISLIVLSPDDKAITDFTSPITRIDSDPDTEDDEPEYGSRKIVIQRKIEGQEESDRLENTDLVLSINILDDLAENAQPIVISFDIDPPIKSGYHHVFTFSQKRSSDYFSVEGIGNTVNCKLYDGMNAELDQLSSVLKPEHLSVTNPEQKHIGTFIAKSQLRRILANMGDVLWDEEVVAKSKKKIALDEFGVKNYALVIEGVSEKLTSNYHITIRI